MASSALILLLLFFPLFVPLSSNAYAATADKDLSNISKKIEAGKKKVEEAKKEERSLAGNLRSINSSISKNSKEADKYNGLISINIKEISRTGKEISLLQENLKKRRALLVKRLQALYKNSRTETAMLFISSDDYLDLLKRGKYISSIAEHDIALINDLNSEVSELAIKKAALEGLRSELQSNRLSLKERRDELQLQRAKKSSLLELTRKRRSRYEEEIRELTRSSKRIRAMIKRLSRLQRAEPVADRKFTSVKGSLMWPINGKVLIPFGKYIDPEFNVPVYKNGIEIKAAAGSSVSAVMDGKVVFADNFKGYGLLVILDHGGGYHTLYGQLSKIFHNTGAIIKKASAIGKTGMSTSLDTSTLYFEIRHKGKPLNPLIWLTAR